MSKTSELGVLFNVEENLVVERMIPVVVHQIAP
jgi:hypothetical protein